MVAKVTKDKQKNEDSGPTLGLPVRGVPSLWPVLPPAGPGTPPKIHRGRKAAPPNSTGPGVGWGWNAGVVATGSHGGAHAEAPGRWYWDSLEEEPHFATGRPCLVGASRPDAPGRGRPGPGSRSPGSWNSMFSAAAPGPLNQGCTPSAHAGAPGPEQGQRASTKHPVRAQTQRRAGYSPGMGEGRFANVNSGLGYSAPCASSPPSPQETSGRVPTKGTV